MNLRELTEDQNAILAQVESGDFTLEQVEDHLDMLDSERKQKIENYLHVINRLDSEVVAIQTELARLDNIRSSKAASLENIKSWLLMSMKDGEKHEFDLFKVSRVSGREKVSVIDEKKIGAKYLVHKPESFSVDKRSLLADLKRGDVINGAELTQGEPSLRIK